MAKIIFIIAPINFRDEELFETKEVLDKAGHTTKIASSHKGLCRGSLGNTAIAEELVYTVSPNDYDVIVFIGGPGSQVYFNDKKVLDLAKKFYDAGKIVSAICIAPIILANSGILKGKKATVCSSELGKEMEKQGAIFTDQDVTVDGKIITANGPQNSRLFGKKILALIDRIC